MLGTVELYEYLKTYSLELGSNFNGVLGKHNKKPWSKFITPENKALANNDAIDLLSKMLVYDHVLNHLLKSIPFDDSFD